MIRNVQSKGERCDGFVISGHHTGSFGGRRAGGKVSISDIEELSCKKELMPWFAGVRALWLQGCRTIGAGNVTTCAPPTTQLQSADEEYDRLAAHDLNADGFNISIPDMNADYTAVTSSKNPYGGRWVRAFPHANVYGWTGTAPGDKAQSQLSIPHHIANYIEMKTGEWPEQSFIANDEKAVINLNLDTTNVKKYSSALEAVLCNTDGKACKAWNAHGNHKASSKYGFSNPDLNSFEALVKSKNKELLKAKEIECGLRELNTDEERLKMLEKACRKAKREQRIFILFDFVFKS